MLYSIMTIFKSQKFLSYTKTTVLVNIYYINYTYMIKLYSESLNWILYTT